MPRNRTLRTMWLLWRLLSAETSNPPSPMESDFPICTPLKYQYGAECRGYMGWTNSWKVFYHYVSIIIDVSDCFRYNSLVHNHCLPVLPQERELNSNLVPDLHRNSVSANLAQRTKSSDLNVYGCLTGLQKPFSSNNSFPLICS